MQVADTFLITGRGLVVAVERATDLPTGKRLVATVIRPDGTAINADAFKEWLLRRSPQPVEKESYLLMGLTKEDVPIGSDLRLSVAADV